ncbi:hypothetical protein JYP51_03980 [Ponticoccus gilvus]|nr:hypothetical protein [Enemella evansiae]
MSADRTPEQPQQKAAQDRRTRRRRRRRRGGFAVLLVLFVLTAGAGLGALWAVGRPVDAPPWVRDRIEARLTDSLPGLDIDFGRMSLLIQRSGLARVILWDVEIDNDRGERIAQLADIEAGLSPSALLRGRIALREVQVSGAFLTMTRDPRGRIGLALGDAFAAGTQAPDVAQMIGRVDRLLQDPRLATLDLFEADGLTLRFEDQRARRGWTADGGRVQLLRDADRLHLAGDVALLGGGAGVATVELDASSPFGENRLDFALSLQNLAAQDIATQTPALAWLGDIEAPISGSLRSAFEADGSLGPMQARLEIGAGVLQPNRATRPLKFDGAHTVFAFDPDSGILTFDEAEVDTSLGRIGARGEARLRGLENGWPEGLTGQFTLRDAELAGGLLMDRAIAVSGASLAFKVDLAPFTFTLGALRSTDPRFPLQAKGRAEARPDGWDLSLDTTVSRTTAAHVLAYWPEDFRPNTRRWVAENVRSGILHDIAFSLRLAPGAEEPETFLDLSFSEGQLTYNRRLPGVQDGSGRLTIQGQRLGVRVDSGLIEPEQGGALDVAGSAFVIADLKAQPQVGEIRLDAKGSATAALSYLDNEAWRILEKTGRDASLATGQAEVTGRIALPLIRGLKLPDVTLDLAGTLRDVESDQLVAGRVLAAERLEMRTDGDSLRIGGDVTLDGVAATGTWKQPLTGGGDGQVTADVALSAANLATLGVSLPGGMVSGSGRGALTVDLPKGAAPRFALESDLAGLALGIPQIGWSLGRGSTGQLRVSGALTQPVTVDRLALSGGGLEAEGRLHLAPGGGLDRLDLSRLSVGGWMDVAGRLRGRGAGQAPAVELTSGSIDLRRAPFGMGGRSGSGGGGAGGGAPLTLALDRLQVTDSIELRDFRGTFATARGLEGRFEGALAGRALIKGEAVPQNGGAAFRIRGEDAGDVLRYAGFLKTVQDGTFSLDLAPLRGQAGSFDGLLRIEGARLQKAPIVASLLDGISVVGLIDQLNGPGIFFSEVEARFRLSPSRVVVSRSSAVGPSMGISLDGYYDLAARQMDMQGVLSPIYIVNGIGRIFSRKGEGLIGFNFNLRGAVDAPRVAVNPLSVFTPGMFRDIFRRPPPELSQ